MGRPKQILEMVGAVPKPETRVTRGVKRKQPTPAASDDGDGSERDWHALFNQMDVDGCGSIS